MRDLRELSLTLKNFGSADLRSVRLEVSLTAGIVVNGAPLPAVNRLPIVVNGAPLPAVNRLPIH